MLPGSKRRHALPLGLSGFGGRHHHLNPAAGSIPVKDRTRIPLLPKCHAARISVWKLPSSTSVFNKIGTQSPTPGRWRWPFLFFDCWGKFQVTAEEATTLLRLDGNFHQKFPFRE